MIRGNVLEHKIICPHIFYFRYLYDTPEYDTLEYHSVDDLTDYAEIEQYLLKRNYNMKDIEKKQKKG
jgi:hypothetical protein